MLCESCSLEISADDAFCRHCAHPRNLDCPSCGRANRFDFQFCPACGAHTKGERGAALEGSKSDASMRQLTVMFCDVVDSTSLSTRLGPESLLEVINEYHALCSTVVERFGGHIAQYMGDGVLAYFGYPKASAEAARNAVNAALAVLSELPGLQSGIAVRVGLHTGPVVVAEMSTSAGRGSLAVGEAPNVAARVQQLAKAGEVLITHQAHRLVAGFFAVEDRGEQHLKGFDRPIRVYRVLRETGVASRFEGGGSNDLFPFVGRSAELALLTDRWSRAREGAGRAVLISGGPGVGKSRIVHHFRRQLADHPHTWLQFRCSRGGQNTMLHPIVDLLRRGLTELEGPSEAEVLPALEGALEAVGLDGNDRLARLTVLLSDPSADAERLAPGEAETRRRQTIGSLCEWALAVAREQPLVMFFEDIQWADPSSLELIDLVIEDLPKSRVLIIFTGRSELADRWASRPNIDVIELAKLMPSESEQLVRNVAGEREFSPEMVDECLKRADGVPLFLEELTKTVLESGLDQRSSASEMFARVPATLQDSLMARLDQLGPAREVVQVASVLGREFSYSLLADASGLEDEVIQQAVEQLVVSELLEKQGRPPDATYQFRNLLFQEEAYGSLLESRRRELHATAARSLQSKPGVPVEVLARHRAGAGQSLEAIALYKEAAARCRAQASYREASGHMLHAIEVSDALGEPDRSDQSLLLWNEIGVALQHLEGYGATEVGEAFENARHICERITEPARVFPVLAGQCAFNLVGGRLEASRALADQCLRLAARSGSCTLQIWGRYASSLNRLYEGELSEAWPLLETGNKLSESLHEDRLAELYSGDPAIDCRTHAAAPVWMLGFPNQARASLEAALVVNSSPIPAASVRAMGSIVHQLCGDDKRASEWAEAAVTLSDDEGHSLWSTIAEITLAWTVARSGRQQDGIDRLRGALESYRSMGAELGRSYFLTVLCDMELEADRPELALRAVEEADLAVEERGERYAEPEIHRLRGECLSRVGSKDAAQRCYERAMDVALQQRAFSWRLRAALSLARLWSTQGRQTDAREMLEEARARISEGFDTSDVVSADETLEALA